MIPRWAKSSMTSSLEIFPITVNHILDFLTINEQAQNDLLISA